MSAMSFGVDAESGRTRRINVRIEKDVYAALKARCSKGKNFSAVVNEALREWVNMDGGVDNNKGDGL